MSEQRIENDVAGLSTLYNYVLTLLILIERATQCRRIGARGWICRLATTLPPVLDKIPSFSKQ